MKTYCKNVDITNIETILPWVQLCLKGKEKRSDFRGMLRRYGGAEGVAAEIAKRIENKNLELKPIHFFTKIDGMSKKVRELGVEEPIQICMDYVAVHALMPLFKAKICHYQCASIKRRGQVFGKEALDAWVNGDPSHSKYYAQADVKSCYKTITKETVEKFLRRDVKNETIIWFVLELISTHGRGLSIGSYLSQFLCNYLLSYVYHYASEQLYKERRGKRIRLCYHILFFMDDMIFLGNDKRNVKLAIKSVAKFIKETLHIELKQGYQVRDVEHHAINMMGFVIHRGYTTIRSRIFLRTRRAFTNAAKTLKRQKYLSLKASYRIISYYGFFKHTNSRRIRVHLHVEDIFKRARAVISHYARKLNNKRRELLCQLPNLFNIQIGQINWT